MATTGTYIVVEGVDGSGKSTQAKLLAEHLAAKLIVEPTHGPIGTLIRDRIREGSTNPAVMARLFAADRQDNVEQVLVPALEAGQVVVSDRSLLSSLVYQAEGDLTRDDIWDLNMRKSSLPTPDLVILVEVGLEEALRRVQARGAADTFETRERVARTIDGYSHLANHVRWPFATVDGVGGVEEVRARILTVVGGRLGLGR